MEREHRAKTTSKGQVTIPVHVRRSLGLSPGYVLLIRESAAGGRRRLEGLPIPTRRASAVQFMRSPGQRLIAHP
jgi:AbrB family looped-hinge helix DNA binding protein